MMVEAFPKPIQILLSIEEQLEVGFETLSKRFKAKKNNVLFFKLIQILINLSRA